MRLLDQNGWKPETWQRGGEGANVPDAPLIVPFADLGAHLARDAALGVEIANSVRPSELEPYFNRLALIAIHFPGFSDGRGFSIAKSLRNASYRGTLRAVGPLIADQFAYALACGFDEIELPEAMAARQPIDQWLSAARAFRATYQRSHSLAGQSILDRRRAAREASR